MSPRTRWLVAAWIFGALSIAALVLAVYAAVSATGDPSWPRVEGKEIARRFSGIVSPAPPSGKGVRGGTFVTQRWSVDYEYEVAGQRYSGRSTTSHPSASPTVFYSPDDPSISTLAPGVDGLRVAFALVLSVFFFLVSRFCHGAASSARGD